MTTQTPYEPPQHGGPYPTSPPWATPPPKPPPQPSQPPQPSPGAPWGGMQYSNHQHGQLMVPYPEEMTNAGRSKPPSWVPVVLFTFFFGLFGAISASRRASRARRGRNDQHPYWIAFGVSLAACLVAESVAVATIGIPAYAAFREQAMIKVIQENVAGEPGVASAVCEPAGARRTDGLRVYGCDVRLDDGGAGTVKIIVDQKGKLRKAN
jgi:hypothetical protein